MTTTLNQSVSDVQNVTGSIDIASVSKSYGDTEVLSNVNLNIPAGNFLTLLGPSGCGKTTLLRLIAGFIEPSKGKIAIDGRDMNGVPTQKRPIGMVFQNLALFPHFSVAENVAYGLKLRKTPAAEMQQRVDRFIDLVGLSGMGDRRIAQLSGGQKQRVALARSLVLEPSILLLDEPLSALDMQLRKQLQIALKDIQQKLKTTFVFVTHDQEEATMISDTVVVMSNGHVQQVGAPQDIYASPETLFVSKFIGELNEIPARVTDTGPHLSIDTAAGQFTLPASAARGFAPRTGDAAVICLRPEQLKVLPTGANVAGQTMLDARVVSRLVIGPLTRVSLRVGETDMIAVMMTDADTAPLPSGSACKVSFNPDHARLFAPLSDDMASAFGEHA
ncbi:ABC transporter ATP-binding protein [Sulfitobacter sp. 20_GPM-1509m]|uniref:ABC transporter ATP-binding protein n=1 Tax=Sulfitobacter sp. 20_GPM-1509m TaxID=1380367 RepID=UPI000687A0BB|nr:ABC transporter ATP-binding protein [Sulfitobacter sp. 20_GPM-1509m]